MGRKGGIASGAARRRKKSLKQKMQLLLSLPAAGNDQAELAAMGVEPGDMDNEMVLIKALFLSAAEGDTKAFDRIQDVLGRTVAREELALKKQEAKRRAASGEDAKERVSQYLDALTEVLKDGD
ncbi:MAG: hypothetical protein ACLUUJ_08385 [Acutalibacteraceae bacterium]